MKNLYQEYPCSRNAPISCDLLSQTVQEIPGAKFCLECGFPTTLPISSEIKGKRGNYQVTSFLGTRGMGRVYAGTQLSDGRSIVIKEYLLPNRCFNSEETTTIKETFIRVASFDFGNNKSQNFRLINGLEAIADEVGERCYLILPQTPADRTLSQYLQEHRGMNALQIREVLNQTLQTLEFLHAQKIRLSSRQSQQSLAHGNLSLDSIEIEVKSDREFYLYLNDLALWENLFIPPNFAPTAQPSPSGDLADLGSIATYLWAGRTTDPHTNLPLDPKDDEEWSQSDPHLRQFIRKLLGLEPPFETAEIARKALLKLPKIDTNNNSNRSPIADEKDRYQLTKWITAGSLALLLLGGGIWYFFFRPDPATTAEFRLWYNLLAGFSDVSAIPPGTHTYTGEKNGTWSTVLKTQNPESDRPMEDLLKQPRSDLETIFSYEPIASPNLEQGSQPIASVLATKKNFAITSAIEDITDKLDKKQIAYDGLLVYVAFSKQKNNLPQALQGRISLEQLRKIYTGKLTNWKQLNGPDLPIQPYIPTEVEAVDRFKKIVFKSDPHDLELFKTKTIKMDTLSTQTKILKEFDEGRSGWIGFGILSKTWNQCAGYPLAIVNGDRSPVQPLFEEAQKPIDPQSAAICHEKRDKYFDVNTFHNQTNSYVLGYPVFVVYSKDNTLHSDTHLPAGAKFAELLLTRQGQCLLSKIGLVPLQPIPPKNLKSRCL